MYGRLFYRCSSIFQYRDCCEDIIKDTNDCDSNESRFRRFWSRASEGITGKIHQHAERHWMLLSRIRCSSPWKWQPPPPRPRPLSRSDTADCCWWHSNGDPGPRTVTGRIPPASYGSETHIGRTRSVGTAYGSPGLELHIWWDLRENLRILARGRD